MSATTMGPIPTVERELEPREQATYDHRTGTYTMARRYHVWLAMEAALAMDFDTATGYPAIQGAVIPAMPTPPIPSQYDIESPEWSVPFTLWPVTRHAEYLGHDMSANWPDGIIREHCYLTVTYEGHVCMYPPSAGKPTTTAGAGLFNGVVASRFEQGTKSEQILVSYDLDTNGLRKVIGPNNEGTNRLIPTCRWLITQNMTNEDYRLFSDIIQSLVGLTNEANWEDPVYGAQWLEGEWLYLGPQTTQNRDGTYTLVHQFDYDRHNAEDEAMASTTGGMATVYTHKFAWYQLQENKVQVGTGIFKIRKVPIPPLLLSTIYRTAASGVSQGYLFADLFSPQSS